MRFKGKKFLKISERINDQCNSEKVMVEQIEQTTTPSSLHIYFCNYGTQLEPMDSSSKEIKSLERTAMLTCIASSLVGTRTSTRVTDFCFGLKRRRSRMGNMNAAVLPVPVAAQAHKSRPANANGMHAAWIGVGFVNPHAPTAWKWTR